MSVAIMCTVVFSGSMDQAWLANSKYMIAPGSAGEPCNACTVAASSFYATAVEDYIFDYERMLRAGGDDQPGVSNDRSPTSPESTAHDSAKDVKELLALDSDPEVFDAILSIGFANMSTRKVMTAALTCACG